MSFCLNFPLFMIVASLSFSVISTLLKRKPARSLTLILSGTCFVLDIILFSYVLKTNQSYTYTMGHYPHPWGNELKISLLETIISTIFSGVLFFILLGGKESIEDNINENKQNLYYGLCDLINVSLLVLVYTNDIFTGYVFVEICTLASTGILVLKGNGKSLAAAIRYMVFALVGSGLLLFGIVFLYNVTGNLLMPNLKESIVVLWESKEYYLPLLTAMCFISVGVAIKSGLFPFHFWMADTYGSAVSASSGILSGIISKAYIFFLIKVIKDVFTIEIFKASGIANIIYVLAMLGIVIGSISAIRENDIFRMCAYSSAAQIGYIYMGIGLCSNASLVASLFQIGAHAITKPALFLAAYRISKSSDGASKFRNIQGVYKRDLFTSICFSQGALSMVGIPLTAGFIVKYLFGTAAFEFRGFELFATLIVLIISTILNTIYFTKTIIRLFQVSYDNKKRTSATWQYKVAGVVFVLANFVFGIFAKNYIDIIFKGLNIF